MDGEILNYLSGYIGKKLPTHANGPEALAIINAIDKNALLRGYTVREIKEGKADKIIDKLFDDYIRSIIGNGVSFEQLLNYIENLITKKFSSITNAMDKGAYDKKIREMAMGVINTRDREYSKYVDGSYDKVFLEQFKASKDRMQVECRSYVKSLLVRNELNFRCNLKANSGLIDKLVDELLKEKSVEEIVDGYYDKVIITKFETNLDKLSKKVGDYVNNFLLSRALLAGISTTEVVNHITKLVIETGELGADDLFKGRLDNYIDSYAESTSVLTIASNAKSYILEKVRKIAVGRVADDVLFSIRDEIYDRMKQNGCDLKRVSRGYYDESIEKFTEKRIMILASVNSKGKKEKIKYKTKKKKINPKVLLILLIATLTVFAGYKGYTYFQEKIEMAMALNTTKEDTVFDHWQVYSIDNEGVYIDAKGALDFYNEVKETDIDNETYRYLGFYLAYDNVNQDRLYIMDRELSVAQRDANISEEYSEVAKQLEGKSCYLEFAMDRLYEMGFEEIKDDKYVAALALYVRAMKDPSVKKPMEAISPEYQEIIEEIMEKYREYSEKALVDYSESKEESSEEFKELNIPTDDLNNSGRKI